MLFDYIIKRKVFFKGSAALAMTTVASYALGLVRDRQFAHLFGAGRELDAYNAAFMVPDLILNIFVAGALTAAFVPLYTSLTTEDRPHDAQTLTNSVLNGAIGMVVGFGIIAWIAAPWIARLVVPGFDAASQQTYVNIMRILLASPILFAMSNTLGSILVSHERFLWYGLSAALYNLGIILGTWLLTPVMGIYAAAIGAIAGALFHLIPRIIAARRHLAYRARIAWDQNLRSFLRLMVPRMAGHPIEQLTFFAFTGIASTLGAGSIAILNFARNFQSMPVNVIGVTLALTIFPALSRAHATHDPVKFRGESWFTAKAILATAVLAAIMLYFIRRPLVAILLGGGEFDADAIAATAATLALFTLAIPTESLTHLFARSFYALKNSLTPTITSILGLLISVAAGYAFSRSFGVRGLALGFALGSFVKAGALALLLRREIRSRFP